MGLAAAVLFSILVALPFLGKAFHMDEPLFLRTAEHLLADPWRPGAFAFNWYGVNDAMARINNNPPLLAYLLAPVLALTGGRESWTRLAFLPFDALAAAALYLLAGRFLARPLWPALVVLACPAYLVNMEHLMAEKPALAFGAAGLWCLVRGVDGGRGFFGFGPGGTGAGGADERAAGKRWERAAGAFLALAGLSKFGAALFLAPAAAFLLARGRGPGRTAAFCGAALLPLGAVLLWQRLAGLGGLGPSLGVLARSYELADWPHRLRAFLAFAGGCGAATLVWAWPAVGRRPGFLAACGGAGLLLMLPAFDILPVRGVDRLTGLAFASAGAACLGALGLGDFRRLPGWPLWAAWAAAASALQLFLYWGILSRIVLFLVPPLVFMLAERLEARGGPGLRPLHLAGFAPSLALGLGLAWVDRVYADSQRDFVMEAVTPSLARGKRVFFVGHWGLQYYLENAGATAIDESAGGHEALGPGDLYLLSRVNSNNSLLGPPRLSRDLVLRQDRRLVVNSRVPLRLLSGWNGQAGFYADSWGFLPFGFGLEPVEEFALGERQ